MGWSRSIKWWATGGILILLFSLLLMLLSILDTLWQWWERLQTAPAWLMHGYLTALLVVVAVGGVLMQRWRDPPGNPPPARPGQLLDEATIVAKIERNRALGADIEAASKELAELTARRTAGTFHIALLGEISTGKSSLIRALLPEAAVTIGPVGGTTRSITTHHWQTPARDQVLLTDLPGLNGVGDTLGALAREEAIRAQVVVYLCDGDLTREQYRDLVDLADLGKPCILAMNKADRYTASELQLLHRRLVERLRELPTPRVKVELVQVISGGQREILREYPDGRTERLLQTIPPSIDALRRALQRVVDRDPEMVDRLRDHAVFMVAAEQLDEALAKRRRQLAEGVVETYAQKAVIGAMAAVTPGLDVAIQGYLGFQMIRELCQLHDTSVGDLEIRDLLTRVGTKAGSAAPVVLALTGNVLKSFPGVGTVAGGLCHAVAYGLIFDSLGRAVCRTLDQRGELAVGTTVRWFDEGLGANLEERLRWLFRVALKSKLANDPPGHRPS